MGLQSLGLLMTMAGWLSVFGLRRQLLLSLLSLEVATLGFFLFLACLSSKMSVTVSVSFYILVMGACEAALGLALLVVMTRFGGGDLYSHFGFVVC